MIILGIDPGLATVGFGVLNSDGQRMSPGELWDYFHAGWRAAASPADHDLRGCTGVSSTSQARRHCAGGAVFLSQRDDGHRCGPGAGVALIAAANAVSDSQIFEYTPMQIKLAVCGYGHADKGQVQRMVTRLLGLTSIPRPDDAADALAVALCHSQSARMGQEFMIR